MRDQRRRLIRASTSTCCLSLRPFKDPRYLFSELLPPRSYTLSGDIRIIRHVSILQRLQRNKENMYASILILAVIAGVAVAAPTISSYNEYPEKNYGCGDLNVFFTYVQCLDLFPHAYG